MMVLANQAIFAEEEFNPLPSLEDIQASARDAGEKIANQEIFNEKDVDTLTDILLAVAQIAIDREGAISEEQQLKREPDVSDIYENTLELMRIFILEPMIEAVRSVNINFEDTLRNFCSSSMGLWLTVAKSHEGKVDFSHVEKAAERLGDLYSKAFSLREDTTVEN